MSGEPVCGGGDEDCDTLVDEADGDGQGGEPALLSRTPPEGHVLEPGDCDDTDPALNGDDADGESTCDGDCDDTDAEITRADCEFAFDSSATLASGSCISSFDAEFGWDADTLELDFSFTSPFSHSVYSLGSFPGTITAGADCDILEWYGVSAFAQYYDGTFFLYR